MRTMGSAAEEAANLVEREVLMRLTKRESGRRVMEEMTSSPVGRRLG